jgi:hypothetical protein
MRLRADLRVPRSRHVPATLRFRVSAKDQPTLIFESEDETSALVSYLYYLDLTARHARPIVECLDAD